MLDVDNIPYECKYVIMRWLVTSIISTELVESKFVERWKKDLILKSNILAKKSSHSMRILATLQDACKLLKRSFNYEYRHYKQDRKHFMLDIIIIKVFTHAKVKLCSSDIPYFIHAQRQRMIRVFY